MNVVDLEHLIELRGAVVDLVKAEPVGVLQLAQGTGMAQGVVGAADHHTTDAVKGFPVEIEPLGVLLRGDCEVEGTAAQALKDLAGAQVHQLEAYAGVFRLEDGEAFLQPIQHGGQRGDTDGNFSNGHGLDVLGLDLQAPQALHCQLGVAD
ncbi:hypothetical protein D3C84_941500 [compost metagenome]